MKTKVMLLIATIVLLAGCSPANVPTPTSVPSGGGTSTTATSPAAAAKSAPTAAGVSGAAVSQGGTKRLTVATAWPPMKSWAIETDDALVMTRFGILETLTKVDFDGKLVPSLATSWKRNDDTTWEFKLRSGVKFQNGSAFNAAAVVNALTYLIKTPTPPRGMTANTISSVTASANDTVIIKTAQPDPLLPTRLSSPNAGILAPAAYIGKSGPTNPAKNGTGPFILSNEVPNQSWTLVKNKEYWGGMPKLDEVVMKSFPDAAVRATMVQTGEVDVAWYIPIPQLPILQKDPNLNVIRLSDPRFRALYMNTSRKPFDDLRVRQAVAYAIDKKAIVDAVLEGVGSAAVGPFRPTDSWANPELKPVTPDVNKAKQLLADAGYKAGEPKVSIWSYPDRPDLPPTAMAIQGMLQKAGFSTEVRIAPYDALSKDVLSGNYDMIVTSRGYMVDTYDPEGFLTSDFTSKGSFNMAMYRNKQVDDLMAKARTLDDNNARTAIFRQVQQILYDDVAGVWLNYSDNLWAVRKTVLNYRPHPLGQFELTPDIDIAK